MFNMILDMPNGTSDFEVECAMPSWWMVDNTQDKSVLKFYHDSDVQNPTGFIKRYSNKIEIKADETTLMGKRFWLEFAILYPELNPFTLKTGVLFLTDPEKEVFELDELPNDLPPDVLDKVASCAKTKDAYLVEYLLGNWHPNSEITVTNYKQILENGRLGPKMPGQIFKLSSIENEKIM